MRTRCTGSRERCLTQSKQPIEIATTPRTAALFAPAQRTMTQSPQTGSMKQIALPTTELTVDEVMQRWPSTIRVFLDFGMRCVGCPIATFHSVDEACREHGIDLEKFLGRLRAAAQGAQMSRPGEAACGCPSASPNRA
jgi:hybrid cluster-associated redox disulfide protein